MFLYGLHVPVLLIPTILLIAGTVYRLAVANVVNINACFLLFISRMIKNIVLSS
jgi:hypothetical protein